MSIIRIAAIIYNTNERNMGHSITVDATRGFVYVLLQTPTNNIAAIDKIRISDFTRINQVTYSGGAPSIGGRGVNIDVNGGFAFFTNSAGRIIRANIQASSFGISNQADTSNGEIAIDITNNFYYSPHDSLQLMAKGNLATLAAISNLSLTKANPAAVVIDLVNNFIYCGHNNIAGDITKINLPAFTINNILASGAGTIHASAIDPMNGFAYFVGSNKLIKLNLSTNVITTLTSLNFGVNAGSIVINPLANALYVGNGNAVPGVISEVDLTSFSITSAITLNSGENFVTGMAYDTPTGIIYAALNTNPGIVVKLQGLPEPPRSPRFGINNRISPYVFNQNYYN